jgi:hypothetical protein
MLLPDFYLGDDVSVIGGVHRGRHANGSVFQGRHEGTVIATRLNDDVSACELADEVHG